MSILDPNILIESDEIFWMEMDEHGDITNYEGDEWPLPEGSFTIEDQTEHLLKYLDLMCVSVACWRLMKRLEKCH